MKKFAFLLACLSLPSFAHENSDDRPPKHLKIAYVSYESGSANIYLMDSNGKNSTQLTSTPENNRFPAQLNHKTVGFSKFGKDGKSVKYQVNVKSKKEKPQKLKPIAQGAEWEEESPNGKYIAFVRTNSDYVNELFLYDKRKRQEIKLTENEKNGIAHSINHRWSYDGKKLAFMSGPDWYSQFVKVYDVETGEISILTKRGYMNSGLLWLHDNRTLIVNIKIKGESSYELWRLDVSTLDLRQLTEGVNLHPSLSPDGQWVLFESQRNGDDGDIYVMKPDGSNQLRITQTKEYEGRAVWFDPRK